MKSILLSVLFVLIATTGYCTVLIVDQNGSAPTGTYSTFSTAHNAATAGDTILLIPSTADYGNITISKQLTVLGPGFNPGSSSGETAKVSSIYFQAGSDGSKIIGLEITSIVYLGYTTATSLTNVVIENCLINYITTNSTSTLANIIIRQNVFQTNGNASSIVLTVSNQSNIVISNNIFARPDNGTYGGIHVTTGGALIEHNLFLGTGTTNSKAFRTLSNCEVRNNIFYGRNPVIPAVSNSQFYNNLSFGSSSTDLSDDNGSGVGNMGFGTNVTGDNNISNQNPAFVGTITINSSLTSWDFAYDVTLDDPSPASGAAKDGSSDLGIFGGSSPFKTSGSVVPVVQTLDLPTTIQQGTNTTADIVVTGN